MAALEAGAPGRRADRVSPRRPARGRRAPTDGCHVLVWFIRHMLRPIENGTVPFQNRYFMPNWMTRPSCAEEMRPNVAGVPIAAAGLLKRTWLKTLNASTPDLDPARPPSSTFLNSDRSVRREPGAADRVATGIARPIAGLRQRPRHEARRVEPLIGGVRRVVVRIAGRVGPVGQEADVELASS